MLNREGKSSVPLSSSSGILKSISLNKKVGGSQSLSFCLQMTPDKSTAKQLHLLKDNYLKKKVIAL